jgi:retinol-binding protein 3
MKNSLDSTIRQGIIEHLIGLVREHYIFPTVAEDIAVALRQRQQSGAYDHILDRPFLADMLTADMQAISHDQHFTLVYEIDEPLYAQEDEEPLQDDEGSPARDWQRELGAVYNYGFERVERLAGNIGYLRLRAFFPAELAAEVAAAAMNFLANTEALLIDLREAGGGEPDMVTLLCSYFFPPEPVHLNDIYWRSENRTQQFWTHASLPGRRYLEKPVYILTSRSTPSAAEEFAYDLQSRKRATIIGETTSGQAHPHERYQITDHFACWIPVGRAINPITGTSWEGTGVKPEKEVAERDAYRMAYRLALQEALGRVSASSAPSRQAVKQEIEQALAEMQDECSSS